MCPKCGSNNVHCIKLNMRTGRHIWKCNECGKEWKGKKSPWIIT